MVAEVNVVGWKALAFEKSNWQNGPIVLFGLGIVAVRCKAMQIGI